MTSNLAARKRQKRALNIPSPDRKGNIKVTRAGWIECAKVVLIEEGIGAVKIDRLARRLGVTRGGFYYHFKNHHSLLEDLLLAWREQNRFTPPELDASSPAKALVALETICDNLIHERGFDPQFDLAVREWARVSKPVAQVVHAVDDERTAEMQRVFRGLGCDAAEAFIRAKVLYTHQIGTYTIGVDESTATRERNLKRYLDVLGGEAYRHALGSKTG